MATIATQMIAALARSGVRRVYGLPGDSLNGFTDALRRDGTIDWVHVRHEEGAAFAASADAELTGDLAVCVGSCGPGNLHRSTGCSRRPAAGSRSSPSPRRSRAPRSAAVTPGDAPAGPVPGVQRLHRARRHPAQMPRVFEIAMRAALERRGRVVRDPRRHRVEGAPGRASRADRASPSAGGTGRGRAAQGRRAAQPGGTSDDPRRRRCGGAHDDVIARPTGWPRRSSTPCAARTPSSTTTPSTSA